MSAFTLDEFFDIARRAAGEDDTVVLDGRVADTSFRELDVDSLSIVAIVTEIEQERAIRLGDDVRGDWTPRRVVDLVNDTLSAAATA